MELIEVWTDFSSAVYKVNLKVCNNFLFVCLLCLHFHGRSKQKVPIIVARPYKCKGAESNYLFCCNHYETYKSTNMPKRARKQQK